MEWKTVVATIGVVSICFLVIPIKIEPSDSTDNDLKLFETYVDNYKKSYARSPDEYSARFKIFQVRSAVYMEKSRLMAIKNK